MHDDLVKVTEDKTELARSIAKGSSIYHVE